MITILDSILFNLIDEKRQRVDTDYDYLLKVYHIKAYWVGKIIRIDIKEVKKEK